MLPSSHAAGGTASFTAAAPPGAWIAWNAAHRPGAGSPAASGRDAPAGRPADVADVVVRVDDPRHPALVVR